MTDNLKELKMNLLEKGGYEAVPTEVEPVKPRQQPKKKSSTCRSCCGRCILMTLAVIFGLYVLVFAATYVWIRHQVIRFTVPTKGLPTFETTPAVVDESHLLVSLDKAKLFWDTLAAGEIPEEDLIISEAELNSAIANSDYMRGHSRVTLSDQQALFEYALPMDGLPGGFHRSFVGSTKIVTDVHGRFAVTMTPEHAVEGLQFDTIFDADMQASVMRGGQPVLQVAEGHFLNWVQAPTSPMANANYLQCHDDCPHHKHKVEDCHRFMGALAGIQSISFEEGQIVVKPRRAAEGHHRELQEMETTDAPMAWMMARRVLHTILP